MTEKRLTDSELAAEARCHLQAQEEQRDQNIKRAKELAAWLRAMLGAQYVRPVRVLLARMDRSFYGARWTQALPYTEGMQCVREGTHKAGETYLSHRIDLLGKRPIKLTGRRHFAFTFEDVDWYIGSYYDGEDQAEHHPFGAHFSLHPWDFQDGSKIDDGAIKPYARFRMKVEDLTS